MSATWRLMLIIGDRAMASCCWKQWKSSPGLEGRGICTCTSGEVA